MYEYSHHVYINKWTSCINLIIYKCDALADFSFHSLLQIVIIFPLLHRIIHRIELPNNKMSLFEPNEINGKYQKTTLKLDESGNSSTGSDDGFEYIGGSENALHDQKTLLKIITENKRLTRELEELKLDMKELKQSNGQLIGRNLIEDRIAADSTDKSKVNVCIMR